MENEDPRVVKAASELHQAICTYMAKGLSSTVLHEIDEMVVAHRRAHRSRGTPFPELVVIALPSVGGIQVVRRDLSEQALTIIIRNLMVQFPHCPARELLDGVYRVFPHARPNKKDMADWMENVAEPLAKKSTTHSTPSGIIH